MRKLYLTFDDGPGQATGEILDVLDAAHARPTFFATGKNLTGHHRLARRAVTEGHVVAART